MKSTATNSRSIRRLCEGALIIALAEILSFLPLYKLPWGGSMDLAMVPVFLFCARWGFGSGMLMAAAHGVLQTLFEGGIAIGWQSILGDFLIAYAVLGVAGLFWRLPGGYYWGTLAGCILRFLVHYVVGATIWAAYMPESFFGMTMTSPWIYSGLYNASYMLPNCLLTLLVGFLLKKSPVRQYLEPVSL